ncbi:cellobiose phosphorylase [Oryzihumus leptocrescens]|uniref:cellobiose phosphorylase n=1 Tax=Oryzihumus leptocrescens TaxID=297536 RepID=UPI003CCC8C4F
MLRTGFFGLAVPHHPAATSSQDADLAALALRQPEAVPSPLSPDAHGEDEDATAQSPSLFTGPALPARDLTTEELASLAGDLTDVERDGEVVLSAFTEDGTHLVTAAKERAVLRPHGHILRTGNALVPDSGTLTSTSWMTGGFHSQVTQGHVSRGTVLSTRRTYLGLLRAHGLRVFVEHGTGWQLLDLPSAWAVSPGSCRWWYATDDLLLEVAATAPTDTHELGLAVRVLHGEPRRLLVSLHSALGEDDGQAPAAPALDGHASGASVGEPGASLRLAWPTGSVEQVDRDGTLFADGASRGLPFVTLVTAPASAWGLTLAADVVPDDAVVEPSVRAAAVDGLWDGIRAGLGLEAPQGSARAQEVARLDRVLPWFAHDAFVHYLSPRGLEQFTGGGWGTRDVCQGPVGLLLTLGRTDALREVLLLVLRAQNERGDWPQAFDFLPPIPQNGQAGSHGDVVFWPLLALGEYLLASGDGSLLTAEVPFVGDDAPTQPAPALAHARRALTRIRECTVPGSPLPAYGHGDWNDSLQPADPQLAARLVSTWTATLQVHALRTLAAGLREAAPTLAVAAELADDAERLAEDTAGAMHEVLLADGLLAGYGLMHDDGRVEHLVHPTDERTGLTYGVLPWIHAISADLLSPEQADHHLATIREHLLGPDGARLFDKPAAYRGGPMEVFQRAEGSTFWGREIGLMYTHAHLRYAEALARRGDAERLFEAFCLANPVGITERVPQARPRQATTYYSSSDGAFADRYEAAERYPELMAGNVALEGGWRVYSSGPGLFLRLLQECVLGLRRRGDRLEVDPVLPLDLDGLTARIPLGDTVVRVEYAVRGRTSGPSRVGLNGTDLPTSELTNPYRPAGVSVDLTALRAALTGTDDVLTVEIS